MMLCSRKEGCYYVSRNKIYIADNWDSVFQGNSFSLKDGVLPIDKLILPNNEEPLVFTRVE